MVEIKNTFTYSVPPEKVYAALTEQEQFKQWWTPDAVAKAQVGTQARFEFNPYGDFCVMKITALEPNKVVEWQCVSGKMMGTEEWVGTTITFTLTPSSEGTTLTFSHSGWKDTTECFEKCTQGWAHFLGDSLKQFLETGTGQPFKPEETSA